MESLPHRHNSLKQRVKSNYMTKRIFIFADHAWQSSRGRERPRYTCEADCTLRACFAKVGWDASSVPCKISPTVNRRRAEGEIKSIETESTHRQKEAGGLHHPIRQPSNYMTKRIFISADHGMQSSISCKATSSQLCLLRALKSSSSPTMTPKKKFRSDLQDLA